MITLVTLGVSTSIIVVSFTFQWIDPDRRASQRIANTWGKIITFLNPTWSIKIQGRGYIQEGKSYVLAANHASFSDIIFLYCLGKQFKWVAKDSLFKIPFFGWAMSALKYVRLIRGNQESIRNSFDQCFYWLNRNMSLLIFPEGTRSVTGKLGSFKNGAFRLAIKTRKPVVPIALTGTSEVIKKGSAQFSPNIRCKIKVLKPIQTTAYREDQYGELRDLVRARMIEAIEEGEK
ncbi:MAG: 1-acyl-sn-glycerol-3-phosphate acyltransferase [Candidatus Omnitrophica bacterium]|nr:1-acyl-sn-glycerol-3-phosphate acyltransferase [Candidatus Omnitrophota bacterium]